MVKPRGKVWWLMSMRKTLFEKYGRLRERDLIHSCGSDCRDHISSVGVRRSLGRVRPGYGGPAVLGRHDLFLTAAQVFWAVF